jgi:hypothetical protein
VSSRHGRRRCRYTGKQRGGTSVTQATPEFQMLSRFSCHARSGAPVRERPLFRVLCVLAAAIGGCTSGVADPIFAKTSEDVQNDAGRGTAGAAAGGGGTAGNASANNPYCPDNLATATADEDALVDWLNDQFGRQPTCLTGTLQRSATVRCAAQIWVSELASEDSANGSNGSGMHGPSPQTPPESVLLGPPPPEGWEFYPPGFQPFFEATWSKRQTNSIRDAETELRKTFSDPKTCAAFEAGDYKSVGVGSLNGDWVIVLTST